MKQAPRFAQCKVYFMMIKGILKSLDIVMLIGQDILFSLKEILSLRKARNKKLIRNTNNYEKGPVAKN